MAKVIVTGSGSGLGQYLLEALGDVGIEAIGWTLPGVDVRDDLSVSEAVTGFIWDHGTPDGDLYLINCAGINYINHFDQIASDAWDNVMNTNVKAIWRTSAALLEYLRGGTIVNIVSNASHMPMTHSAVYNASKGAAHILTLQMARELKKTHDITVFGVSPNKMKGTQMSSYINKEAASLRGWSEDRMAQYQLTSLPAGEETDPALVAEFIAFLLSSKARHKFMHGCIIPYGA
jgi:2,3-dihydro-2,3-dihydroxybenzoate dehydrogenase